MAEAFVLTPRTSRPVCGLLIAVLSLALIAGTHHAHGPLGHPVRTMSAAPEVGDGHATLPCVACSLAHAPAHGLQCVALVAPEARAWQATPAAPAAFDQFDRRPYASRGPPLAA